MKIIVTAFALALTTAPAVAQEGTITPAADRATVLGPSETFTGTAFVVPTIDISEDRDFSMAEVTFLPGARSNWHTHPRGQTILVTSGTGWTQEDGGTRQTINAGDVVWCPPDVRHWHGATDQTAMSHIVVNQPQDESVVDWMEPVTDEQYLAQ
ncbi:cupin domain-containing protein [Paracoccus aurantiacus]|uniref:Cupin domain-containing protein n=1 Tax=Paracoccus aurantiacus TaxID=2599412 RepID=A0A5C6RVA2_9RHOB|nr:cupin domain-containing protein [Paracoccus aurantiacus]TXB66466.1 cupin domain-containing protein [Paracoccus aurantiacus]